MLLLDMTKIEDIEKAVANLPAEDLAKFRAWFEEFDARLFDKRIAGDAQAGKLDRLANEALTNFRSGRARRL
jgi:hypothetical protein